MRKKVATHLDQEVEGMRAYDSCMRAAVWEPMTAGARGGIVEKAPGNIRAKASDLGKSLEPENQKEGKDR